MNFNEFQKINSDRSRALHPKCETLEFLSIAIAGEAGELCNKVKKVLREDVTFEQQREAILDEIADVISYSDLLMSVLNENTENRLMKKFEEVSDKWGYVAK